MYNGRMKIHDSAIKQFQTEILAWYKLHKRDLPWRRTRNPYKILISEVMLQQTQVSRVIPKFEAWLEVLPTVQALAIAKTTEILRLWSGLGYNRRALYLQRAAQAIIKNYQGIFPQHEKTLQALPGIGEYTSRAVVCFAFNKQIAVVDTNIRKVIALRFFQGVSPLPKELQVVADHLLPKGKAYEWNQALMDYAAAVLKKEKVSIPKQSPFLGSKRFYRGQILKFLLIKKKMAEEDLIRELQHYKAFDATLLSTIAQDLVADGFLEKVGNTYRIKQ